MKKVDILSRRILLSIFQDMLIAYLDDDKIILKESLKLFWDDNIASIKFHASFLTRRPYEDDLKDLADEIEEMEVMFYFLFHFSNRKKNWFKASLYRHNELQRRESVSYIQMSDFLQNMREGRGKNIPQNAGRQLCKHLVGVTTPSELSWLELELESRVANREKS